MNETMGRGGRWASVLACLIGAVGCGAPDLQELPEEELSVGHEEQPVYADDAYGFDGRGNRCWLPNGWGKGRCIAPRKKTWKVRIPTVANNFHCGIDTVAAIETAVREWEWQLNVRAGHGWNVSHTTGPNADFTINCQISSSSAALGKMVWSEVPPILGGSWVCEGNSPRQFCRFGAVSSLDIWPNAICPPLSCKLNRAQFQTKVTNVVLHELFHVAGLGHDTCAETPMMGPEYCGDIKFIATPTDFEISMLQRYNPGSGTKPM